MGFSLSAPGASTRMDVHDIRQNPAISLPVREFI